MSPAKQKETSLRIMVLDLCAGELEGGRREPKKNKPQNHDGTGSSRRETKGGTKGGSLEIMMELDPVEGGQTGRSLKIMMGLDPVEGRQREVQREVASKS